MATRRTRNLSDSVIEFQFQPPPSDTPPAPPPHTPCPAPQIYVPDGIRISTVTLRKGCWLRLRATCANPPLVNRVSPSFNLSVTGFSPWRSLLTRLSPKVTKT